jgi:3',5'-cyclic-nucleotide phosphodiesterase
MKYLPILVLSFMITASSAQPAFRVIPLGVKGGSDESNLSAYAVAASGSTSYVCLDAGTLHAGIRKAIDAGLFTGDPAGVLKNNIRGYLISHPHLDHLAGLVINSPDDGSKPIYALPFCLNVFREKYFTWLAWANFANEGEKPQLGKYRYVSLAPAQEVMLENTELYVRPYALSHSGANLSTAFLVRHDDSYILYLGDTGPDALEKSTALNTLWQDIAPIVKSKKLKAIFIEVSFANEQPDHLLFGHLTPKHLITELTNLSRLTGIDALKDFPVVVTHIKPAPDREKTIMNQLAALNNTLKIKFIQPQQAVVLEF